LEDVFDLTRKNRSGFGLTGFYLIGSVILVAGKNSRELWGFFIVSKLSLTSRDGSSSDPNHEYEPVRIPSKTTYIVNLLNLGASMKIRMRHD
jgi:hypothetical protein